MSGTLSATAETFPEMSGTLPATAAFISIPHYSSCQFLISKRCEINKI
jgi:hypothetical protein